MATDLAEALSTSTIPTLHDTPAQDSAGPALRRLASNLAHNVNNALTGVIGFIELALQEAQPGTSLHDRLSVSRNCALEIARLVQRLVTFASPHRPEFPVGEVLLHDMAEQAIRHARQVSSGEKVSFFLDGRCTGRVHVSALVIWEVLELLIQNAREAMPRGGTVVLSAWDDGDSCCLGITDKGEGMTRDVQAHLFEPFFTTKCSGHLGLGLVVCRSLVESQGGTIRVRSVAGSGTTVILSLKRAETGAAEFN